MRTGKILNSVILSEDAAVKRAWVWRARRIRVEGPLRFTIRRVTVALLLVLLTSVAFPQTPPEHRISPDETRELLGAVDRILKFDSEETALPIRQEVKRRLASREEVEKYIDTRLREDEDAQRLKKGQVVLKKFGLLPRDFDMERFLVSLLKEQVAGYYDPKTKTVNLLNWLEPETQMPVLAHELTHALQDQNFGLEKWVRGRNNDKSPAANIISDEETAARHAVIEGQAMAVMIDWMLAPTGQSIISAPNIADAMEAGMAAAPGSPVFENAPLYLKSTLLFPYTYGLNFERELLSKSKDRAFAGVFKNPPANTRQVMEPAVYLAGEKLPPLIPPADLEKLIGPGWERFDAGSIGEFDVAVIAQQFTDLAAAKKIYPGWRGGYYYAVRKNGADATGTASIGLVFVTRWADAAAAHEFSVLYYNTISDKRYKVTASLASNPPMWNTTEGAVSLAEQGDMVVAIESIDAALHQPIRDAVLKSKGPISAAP